MGNGFTDRGEDAAALEMSEPGKHPQAAAAAELVPSRAVSWDFSSIMLIGETVQDRECLERGR